jgi:hypothetical protein
VDDDNEPAPENIPLPQENNKNAATDDGRTWGWAGIDHRKQATSLSTRAGIKCLSGLALEGATMLTIFLNSSYLWGVLAVSWVVALHEHLVGFYAEQLLDFKASLHAGGGSLPL